MKLNIKSRKGFTLIELLVVIGILAVLAAIAIPSVAGLIDRANVSADKTNSNEMTNAVERFTSEYELYCQDIASGALDEDNLDSAQGRVKNVIGVTTRAGIEGIEYAQSATIDDNVIAIYRDTKYPANAKTMQLVVQNYTKTSSSTFEPKQSDMHYWYSPDCGVVVVAEPTKTAVELDKYVISGMDAKGNDITSDSVNAQWIDLTLGVALSGGASLDMSTVDSTLANNDWATIAAVIKAGKTSEAGWSVGDSKELTINGGSYTTTIIGINHDGNNTATFMIVNSGGIDYYAMNTDYTNAGGWKDSEMRTWLNTTIYENMTDAKTYIKEITKMTNNTGYQGTTATSTSDKVFLLSPKEAGVADDIADWYSYPEEYKTLLETEGNTYAWFESNTVGGRVWLRSPIPDDGSGFFFCDNGGLNGGGACDEYAVCPAFVIG